MVFYNGAHSMTFLKKKYDRYPISNVLTNYDQYHKEGLIKHSWKDWNLIPCDGEYIAPPIMKRSSIDIPGRSGSIDLSTVITGYPAYQNRTGSFEFYFASRNILENESGYSWSEILSEISKFFNSSSPLMMILEDDKFFYYEGYFSVNSFKSDKTVSKIVIDYNLHPYKQAIISTYDYSYSSTPNWLWDPFDFNNGYIQKSLGYISEIHDGDSVMIICGDEPKIINVNALFLDNIDDNTITIKCNNEPNIEYKLTSGRKSLLNNLQKNVNVEKILTFNFTGGGHFDLEIEYVGGYL